MFTVFPQMARKFRIAVHRKNEFRKKRADKRSYAVKLAQSFPIRILLDLVTVLKVSISKHVMQPVSSVCDIRHKLQTISVLPTG